METEATGEFFAESTIPEPGAQDGEGKVVLRPELSRWGKFLVTLFLALLVNAILINHLLQGDVDISRNLALAALICLAALACCFYFLMGLLNPRLTLWIRPARVRPGQTFTVGWEFHGPVERLKNLRLHVEGMERATRLRSNTRGWEIHEHVFHSHPVFEIEDHAPIASGTVQITPPADVIHSFDARHNKIIWRFRLQGEIHRWPDIREYYPFVLSPETGTRQ